MISGMFKILMRITICILCVTTSILAASYVVAGVAVRGDWDRVDNAIERAYNEFLEDDYPKPK